MKKRLLSIAITLCMVVGLFVPASANTVSSGMAQVIVGDFTLTTTDKDGLLQNTDYRYANNTLTVLSAKSVTISGKTQSDRIEVADGVNADITLSGVEIDASANNTAAFKIADNSSGNVTVTLAAGTQNKLVGGADAAGLQKNGAYTAELGTLTICGKGELNSEAYFNESLGTNGDGAGIGGGYNASTANIVITDGTVKATGGYGAGIGGGENGSAENITISGGNITAKSKSSGAGIGGGENGSAENITISGGRVFANANIGAGIGGGRGVNINTHGENITISAGVVTAISNSGAGIGGGGSQNDNAGSGKNISLTGGGITAESTYGAGIGGGSGLNTAGTGENIVIKTASVKVKSTEANAIGGGYFSKSGGKGAAVTPIDGTLPVFLVSLSEIVENRASITVDGVEYPTTHDTEKKAYIYIAAGYHEIAVKETTDGAVDKAVYYMDLNGTLTKSPQPTKTVTGGFTVYGDTTAYTYDEAGGLLKINSEKPVMVKNTSGLTAETSHTIEVADGVNANVSLAGVNISGSTAAFKIADDSTGVVTVTLMNGTENKLNGGRVYAALQKNGTNGKLVIRGGGSLTATTNDFENNSAAAIGSAWNNSAGGIVIEGGNIKAVSVYGAGIGGGGNDKRTGGKVSDIVFAGGTIHAESTYGAAIGSGRSDGKSHPVSDISIINSAVYAKSKEGVGIGSGNAEGQIGDVGKITIIDSAVSAISENSELCGIDAGKVEMGSYGGNPGIINVSGSSLIISKERDVFDATLTWTWVKLYKAVIENPKNESVTIDGKTWRPVNHKAVDGNDTNLYAYLPLTSAKYTEVCVGDFVTPYFFNSTTSVFEPKRAVLLSATGTEKGYYETLQEAIDAAQNGETVKLIADTVIDKPLVIEKNITLDLDGNVLKYENEKKADRAIEVEGGNLTLTDSNTHNARHRFTPNADGLWVLDEKDGTKTVTGGVITGATNSGIFIGRDSTATMHSGNIVGCSADVGGGLFIADGKASFTMNGGSILGCMVFSTDDAYGGGVMNNGSFTMNGNSSIEECGSRALMQSSAGGIKNNGSFTMNGNSSIKNCFASIASALSNTQGEFTMNGGSITGCSANAIYNNGVAHLKGITLDCDFLNNEDGIVSDGTFSGSFTNDCGTVNGGTFDCDVINKGKINDNGSQVGIITGGTFNGTVTNEGEISGGTFGGSVENKLFTIPNRTPETMGTGLISGGTFGAAVTNKGRISGGIFYGGLTHSGDSAKIVETAHSITFKNGTSNHAIEILDNNAVSYAPKPVTKTNWTFNGWLNGTAAYSFGSAIDTDLVLSASLSHNANAHKDETPKDHKCDDCGKILDSCYGGTANCLKGKICTWCGTEYTQPDTTNHADGCVLQWTVKTATQHKQIHTFCQTVEVALSAHNFINGVCDDCDYERLHTVSFNTNGGSTPVADKTNVKWSDKVLENIAEPVYGKQGYYFKGWKCGDKTVTADTTYGELAGQNDLSVTLKAQWLDIQNPTGEIKIGNNSWKSLLNNITFGLFFKDTQSVTITATDNSEKTVKTEYFVSNEQLTLAQLNSATFTLYNSGFSIAPNTKLIIYARLTDSTGNIAYISSNGIVLDDIAPVVSGIENDKIYCKPQTVTVSDDNALTVSVNGNAVTPENGTFTLSVGSQTVVVTDASGNSVTYTVTINDGHSGGKATCTKKAVCGVCGVEYGSVDSKNHSLEHTGEKAATATQTGNIEYWHCTACDGVFADESCTTAVSLSDTVVAKLAPEIIEGVGQTVTADGTKSLTFRSNAAFEDFVGVEVDGETLAEKHYTAKSGSTVVTLKAEYLATLSAGEHEISIVSTTGRATTAFTVNAKAEAPKVDKPTAKADKPTSPKTGETPLSTVWLAVLLLSGNLLIITGVFAKKKRRSAE